MVRLSVRVNNIVSIEMRGGDVDGNASEFMSYCMNLWMALLGRIYS